MLVMIMKWFSFIVHCSLVRINSEKKLKNVMSMYTAPLELA